MPAGRDTCGPTPWTRRLRFDPAPGAEPTTTHEKASLLALFRAVMRARLPEQRRTPRHDAGGFQVWVGWWKHGWGFVALTARLVNISRGGALLAIAEPPDENQEVWICLDVPDPDECGSAVALEVAPTRRGEWSLRVEFSEPCPSDLFQAAVSGLRAEEPHRPR